MHKPILRRVGLVLLLASSLEFAWMIYLAGRRHGLSYDFTIMVGAIALLVGSLKFAHIIRRLLAFGLGALLCLYAYLIVTEPLSLISARLRLQTLETAGDMLSALLSLIAYVWAVRELSRPEILADAPNHGFAWITPRVAFAGGIGLAVILGAVILPSTHRAGEKALLDAKARLGPSFRYHLADLGLDYQNGVTHVSGTVTAWNDFAIVDLPFAWDQ